MASFVGREEELELLQGAFERARGGSGSFVAIHGDAGIGKSRLMAELACRVSGCAAITNGRWYESTEVPGNTGLREALPPLVAAARPQITPGDLYLRQVARLGPKLAEALGVEWNQVPVSAPEERYGLWRGVAELFELATRRGPVLLLLDDLQWCDETSLEILVYLAGEVARLPLLVLGAHRDDFGAQHALSRALLQIGRSEGFQQFRLRGLSREQVGSLVEELWHEPAPGSCVDGLFDHTRGNPLFVQELTRHARERLPSPSLWNEAWEDAELPPTIQGLVTERLRRLSPECQQLLSIAAVVGHDSDVTVLQQIAGVTVEELGERTEEAWHAGMLRELRAGILSFAHPVMRSAIYQSISPVDRLDLHLRIANGLESRHAEVEAYASEIAKHLIAAGPMADPAATVSFCLAGARQARASFAFDEARRLLRAGLHALEQLAASDPTTKGAVLTELGYAEMALGQPDEALRVYNDALAIYNDLHDDAGATDVRRWMAATLMHYGRWQEALDVTSAGVACVEEQRSGAYLGLLGNHTLALLLTGRLSEVEPCVEKQLRLAFNRETRAGAHHSAAGWHCWGLGDPAEVHQHFLEARRLFLEEGLQATAAQVALDHAFASYFLGDLAQAHEAIAEAERLGTLATREAVLADVHAWRSLMHAHRGEWSEAERERGQWRSVLDRIGGSSNYGHFARSSLAFELWAKRGPAEARAPLDPEFQLTPPLLARLHIDANPSSGAAVLAQLKQAIPADGGGLFWLAAALPLVASAAFVDPVAGEAYYDALCRYRGALFDWNLVDSELARLAAIAGRWEAADRHFSDARRFCDVHGMRPFLAMLLLARGVSLLKRGGHRREAHALVEEAKTLCAALEMDYAVGKVALVREAPRRGRPAAEGPAGLTAREETVLRLVARGKTSREIAKELVVAERTVENHIASIFRKIGVSNRVEASNWASTHLGKEPPANN